MPRSIAAPGRSVVTNVRVDADCSTERTRPANPAPARARRIHATGASSSGAAKYQTANVSGSQAMVRRTNPATPFGRPAVLGDRRTGRRLRTAAAIGHETHPQQPDNQHVEHDQRLPDVEMRPLERVVVPL